MLITAVCPQCDTHYQVQDSLRGKRMRCPLPTCKHVFLVADAPSPNAPDTRVDSPRASSEAPLQQCGSVGDLIPLLPVAEPEPRHASDRLPLLHAEPLEPAPLPTLEPIAEPTPSSASPAWFEMAPPPRRNAGKTTREESLSPVQESGPEAPPERPIPRESPRSPVAAPGEKASPRPRVLGPDALDAPPPVRRRPVSDTISDAGASPFELPHETTVEHEHPLAPVYEPIHRPRGRWARWVVWPFCILVVLALSAGGYAIFLAVSKNEEKLADKADEQYSSGLYRSASEYYTNLIKAYPESENAPRYEFRAELADIRYQISQKPESPLEQLGRLEELMKSHQKDPLLSEHGLDVGEALIKLLTEYAESAAAPTDAEPLKVLDQAAPAIKRAKAIKLSRDQKPPEWSALDAAFSRVRQGVALLQHRNLILKRLELLASNPSYRAIQEAEALIKEEEPNIPGLSQLDNVKNLLNRLYEGRLEQIAYVREPADLTAMRRGEENEPAILFDPLIAGAPGNAPPDDPIVLALARGVLYALKQSNGRVKWATRVGVDTTALPVRVPARIGSLERILVLSSDTAALTAVDTNGNRIWRYQLGAPSLGKPVIVGQRAYLATYKGDVHEIELIKGELLGRYKLGQPLTLGGALEPGTNRIYFPAAEGCIFVLDVEKQKCEMILYSRHPGGSLRGEPVIVPAVADEPGYLILNQTNGLRAMQMRVFELPIRDRFSAERILEPKAGLEGWTWFQPYHDPEKIVMLSDARVLGLFGVRQAHNHDQPLFPLLPGGGLPLGPLLHRDGPPPDRIYGRSEVVQVQGDDLWVLGANRLQRLRLAWGASEGPRVAPAWKDAPEVGSPLHRSQIVQDRLGQTNLVLVTQPPRRSICWATSIDDEHGLIRWRRQLGLVCAGAPVPIQMPAGDPLFVALDQGGALFSLDPARYVVKPHVEWLSDSANVVLADSLDDNPDQAPVVLPAEDGKSVYVVACPRGGRELVVRHVKPAAMGRSLEMQQGKALLPAPIAGPAAVVGRHLVVPLADGVLARVPLPLPKEALDAEQGPDWRAPRAGPDSRCYVVPLAGDRFLTTDGGRGLTVWQWSNDVGGARTSRDFPPLELPDRIVSAPLRLPGKPNTPIQVCVADSGGILSLVDVRDDGNFKVKKRWNLDGVVTAGPFLQPVSDGVRVGCIVKQSRLVWLDPASDKELWHYDTKGEAIIGQPQLAEGLVVVADQSGQYVGLDPRTGKPVGDGHHLRGSVAPVATPVEFGKGRLLAPLSDGTVLLLAAERLRKK